MQTVVIMVAQVAKGIVLVLVRKTVSIIAMGLAKEDAHHLAECLVVRDVPAHVSIVVQVHVLVVVCILVVFLVC